jgi:type IV pilus assembly protein PilA
VTRRRGERIDLEGSAAGFTLIELLVVIVIIGILAAIAIPVFLNQRQSAYDGAAKSDLRHLAESEEIYLNEKNEYGTIAAIQGNGNSVKASKGVTLSVLFYDDVTGYCLSAKHLGSTQTWYYDSLANGLQPKGTAACPAMTAGTAGDSLSG